MHLRGAGILYFETPFDVSMRKYIFFYLGFTPWKFADTLASPAISITSPVFCKKVNFIKNIVVVVVCGEGAMALEFLHQHNLHRHLKLKRLPSFEGSVALNTNIWWTLSFWGTAIAPPPLPLAFSNSETISLTLNDLWTNNEHSCTHVVTLRSKTSLVPRPSIKVKEKRRPGTYCHYVSAHALAITWKTRNRILSL